MGKRGFMLLVLLLAWPSDAVPAAGEFASVQNARVPGKWPGGRITWYYNPAGRPANLGDAEVIAAVTAAFSDWQRVCQIEGIYAGVTSIPVDPVPATTYVVGWTDFGSPQFHAKGRRATAGGTSTYAPLTGGGIQINISNTEFRSLFDNGSMVGIFHHEIAHTFGLAHSDDPTSMMYANPYNTSYYEQTLQGDDIAACADLYGGKGLVAKEDLRNALPEAGFSVQASVLSAAPGSTPPKSSLGQIDPLGGGPYYFDRHWQNLAAGANVDARWVTPNGSVYLRRTYTTISSSGYRFTTFPDDGVPLPYAGRWAFQVLVDGRLAAITPFEVMRGSVTPVLPFEGAAIGEADAGGNLNWRIVAYGRGNVKSVGIIANSQAATGTAFRARSGDNVAEVWAETDRPRYKLDQDDGQPASSFDVMRQVRFVAGADGLPSSSPLSVSETGTRDAYSAVATVAAVDTSGTGPQGIYVAAVLSGKVYYRQAGGWSEIRGPLATVQAPAVASVDLVRNLDTRGLPAGTTLYVGYGRSVEDLLARGQYTPVRSF